MRTAAVPLLAFLVSGGDLAGPLKYDRAGVELDGKRTPWKDIRSIAETEAAGAREGYDSEAAKPENTAAAARLAADPFDKDALRKLRPVLARRPPATPLRPPFEGRWKAVVDSSGHHLLKVFAIHAIDFVRVDDAGRIFTGSGKSLEEYLGFDRHVLAAADGEVVQAEDHFEDLPPGRLGKAGEANFVTLRHSEEEFTFYGHLRKRSAAVKTGDRVAKGQVLGRVGNSGASGTPHLHFTLLTPLRAGGASGWASVPWCLHGFSLVDAHGAACSIDAKQARPQEGWTLLCPKP